MKNKIYLAVGIMLLIGVLAAILWFVQGRGKEANRVSSTSQVSAVSDMRDYTLTFRMTPVFADFLYERGFWNTNAIRIDKKKTPFTVKSIAIKLRDRDFYRGTNGATLPVIAASKVDKSTDGTANAYYLDVFLDTSQVKKYSDKALSKSVFSAVLSQIYEDTARSTTSYEARQKKYDLVAKITNTAGANPLTVKEVK